ncbi:GNAT family N-acetyltransferase [Corynebacterium pelargi]|uniref:Putative acyltransferase n=1 Tax=Corynebacterium pelargi TaxID=1471400 RepID=A0A410W6D2_9CORY|nr:GNAT family N-acetyltransferase [Corynebacterium pelargi]QAU51589.1 putative acyltransferase [Corynebacterium pelargi]GGG82534.1 ElaA protein [Corynebacterium pelargi]
MSFIFAVSNISELSPRELHELYKLRTDVFVVEQQCPYEEIDHIDPLSTTLHVRAFETGQPNQILGTARVFPDQVDGREVTKLGRFVLKPSHRGTGLGAELMLNSLRLAFEREPMRAVWIAAQEPLKGYYEQFGFEQCGELFDDAGITHAPMLLSERKLAAMFSD